MRPRGYDPNQTIPLADRAKGIVPFTPRPTCDDAALALIRDYEVQLRLAQETILVLRAERDEARRIHHLLELILAKLS